MDPAISIGPWQRGMQLGRQRDSESRSETVSRQRPWLSGSAQAGPAELGWAVAEAWWWPTREAPQTRTDSVQGGETAGQGCADLEAGAAFQLWPSVPLTSGARSSPLPLPPAQARAAVLMPQPSAVLPVLPPPPAVLLPPPQAFFRVDAGGGQQQRAPQASLPPWLWAPAAPCGGPPPSCPSTLSGHRGI